MGSGDVITLVGLILYPLRQLLPFFFPKCWYCGLNAALYAHKTSMGWAISLSLKTFLLGWGYGNVGWSACTALVKLWLQSLALYKNRPGGIHVCNPCNLEVEARGAGGEGYPRLLMSSRSAWVIINPVLKEQTEKETFLLHYLLVLLLWQNIWQSSFSKERCVWLLVLGDKSITAGTALGAAHLVHSQEGKSNVCFPCNSIQVLRPWNGHNVERITHTCPDLFSWWFLNPTKMTKLIIMF